MANFQNAFNLGLRASEEAALAQKEIKDVLVEFARQVQEASQGAIKITQGRARRMVRWQQFVYDTNLDEPPDEIYDLDLGTVPDSKLVPVLCAELVGDRVTQVHVLCDYEIAPAGYPVVLRYANVVDHCHDKVSLERGLESLLAAPQTGDKLRQLLQFASPPADPGSAP
jgi:hypothetical protein